MAMDREALLIGAYGYPTVNFFPGGLGIILKIHQPRSQQTI